LDSPGPNDHAGLVELEVRRVEEEHLADLRVHGIHAKRMHRGAMTGRRHGDLQLDAVRSLQEIEQGDQLLVR
jgi:hypothetical protein